MSGTFPKTPSPSAATSLVVQPSARERFTSSELFEAYEDFVRDASKDVDAETGIKAATYRFGMRVLLVYEESETGLIVLLHRPSRRRILRSLPAARGYALTG